MNPNLILSYMMNDSVVKVKFIFHSYFVDWCRHFIQVNYGFWSLTIQGIAQSIKRVKFTGPYSTFQYFGRLSHDLDDVIRC